MNACFKVNAFTGFFPTSVNGFNVAMRGKTCAQTVSEGGKHCPPWPFKEWTDRLILRLKIAFDGTLAPTGYNCCIQYRAS